MELAVVTADKVFLFLNERGYNFSSERAMIDHFRDGKALLKVIIETIKHFQPTFLRSILAMQSYRISQDLDRHRQSIQFICDFLVAKEIFKATNFQLRLTDIIHPNPPNQSYQNIQNSRELAILAHLVSLSNWNKKVQASNEVIFGRLKLLQKQQKKLREEQAAVTSELTEVQRTKMMERPAFLVKTKQIADIKQEAAQNRLQKNELAGLKVEREREIMDKARQYQQSLYRIEKLQIEISQAKKELSINAPEVRKEKLRQDAALQQVLNKKQHLSNYIIRMRNFLEEKINHLDVNLGKLKNLSQIDHLQNRSNNLKTHSKRLKQNQVQKQVYLKQLQKELENIQLSLKDEEKRQQEQKQKINEMFITKSRLKEVLRTKNDETQKMNDEINKLKEIYRDFRFKIQQIQRQNNEQSNICDHQLRRLIREVEQWNKKVRAAFHESHKALNIDFYNDEVSQ